MKNSQSSNISSHKKHGQTNSIDVLILYFIVIALNFFAYSIFPTKGVLGGLVVSEIFYILIPTVLYMIIRKIGLSSIIPKAISIQKILLSLLIGITSFILMQQFSLILDRFIELPVEYMESRYQLLDELKRAGLFKALLIVGLLPALCEELLFRGVIMKGLGSTLKPLMTTITVSVLFAFFHFDLYLFGVTFLGGLLLTFIGMKASVVYSMIVHFVNNVMVYMIFIKPEKVPFITIERNLSGYVVSQDIPMWLTITSGIILIVSIAIINRRRSVTVPEER